MQGTLIVAISHQALHAVGIMADVPLVNGYADDEHQHSHYQGILPYSAYGKLHIFFKTTAERAGI